MVGTEDAALAANSDSSATLSEQELAELAPFGEERAVAVGEVLYSAGADEYDFFVVLEGEAEILRHGIDGDVVVVTHGPGRFLGELNFLTGQRAYLSARMSKAGRVLAVPRGQGEAARSLGVPEFWVWTSVILPQAFRIVIPALIGVAALTVKVSGIASTIGVTELVYQANVVGGQSYRYFELFTAVGALKRTSFAPWRRGIMPGSKRSPARSRISC